jgi:hypothetical protein
MTDSVADLLKKLRFIGQPVETLYLNETWVHENFIGQLGAIESFTRSAAKEASAEAPVIKIGASMSSDAGVTWSLSDPISQVLILRAALESQGRLHGPDDSVPGRHISFLGSGLVSRPGMFDDEHREGLRKHLGLYDALEAERAKQESVMRMIEGPEVFLWLLTVSEGASVCAAFLDKRLLRPVFSHWLSPGYGTSRWEIFGLCRQVHATGVPMVATLYLGVKWVR